jgi:hypothetical protein
MKSQWITEKVGMQSQAQPDEKTGLISSISGVKRWPKLLTQAGRGH